MYIETAFYDPKKQIYIFRNLQYNCAFNISQPDQTVLIKLQVVVSPLTYVVQH